VGWVDHFSGIVNKCDIEIRIDVNFRETIMKLVKKTLAVATAAAMLAVPVAASAAPVAQKLSVARASAPSKASTSQAGGGSIIYIVAALAAIGIVIAVSGGKKSK
jgi:hypothetical protein